MRNLFFSAALLPSGWAADVTLSLGEDGAITSVTIGDLPPAGAEYFEGLAVPGLVNLHSHAHQRAITGLGEAARGDDDFWSWRDAMYRAGERFDPDLFEAIAAQLFLEMVAAGYTTVTEFHYLHHAPDGRPYADPAEMSHRVVAAARTAGIATTLLPVLYQSSGFGARPPLPGQRRFVHDLPAFLRLTETLAAHYGADDDVVLGIAPHSLRAVPPGPLAELLAACPTGPVHIHVAEQEREVRECLAHTGQRPIAWLLDHHAVDARWCLIHATQAHVDEVARLAASGAVAGLCPTTEANLGDGIFPTADFLAAGGRIGVGSDSNISVDPAAELRALEYVQRLTLKRRCVLAAPDCPSTARRLLGAAWTAGAQAGGRPNGAIAKGLRADIVVLDSRHPLLIGRKDDTILDSWVFAGGAALVKDVVVGGRTVIRDRYHPEREAVRQRFWHAMETLLS